MEPTNDGLFEQIINITKASAYDIVSEQAQKLETENKALKVRVKYLEDLITEYTEKMLKNLTP